MRPLAKYRKRPVTVEAITFAELVEYGKANGANVVNGMPWSFVEHGKANAANVVNGMPWSFEYKGHPITHENDECYLIPTPEGIMRFGPQDMLISEVVGEIHPCKPDIFAATYDRVEEDETDG